MEKMLCTVIFLASLFATSLHAQVAESFLTNHSSNDRYGSYSPDGQQILFESDRSGRWDIYLMDYQTKATKALPE